MAAVRSSVSDVHSEATRALVQAFIIRRLDYCNLQLSSGRSGRRRRVSSQACLVGTGMSSIVQAKPKSRVINIFGLNSPPSRRQHAPEQLNGPHATGTRHLVIVSGVHRHDHVTS